MNLKSLIGAGDRIMAFTLPFAVIIVILNVLYPGIFSMNLGSFGLILGIIFLVVGVPVWLSSAVQVLVNVPKNKLITAGPFAVVLHPLYTAVSLLVIPGIGLVIGTWAAIAIGIVMYLFSRKFSVSEDEKLKELFADDYAVYRSKVLLPWL